MKVPPYYSSDPSDRDVFHDHDDCPTGHRILGYNREKGTAGRARCKECIDKG